LVISRFRSLLDSKAGRIAMSALDPVFASAAVFAIQGAVLISASKVEFATFSLSYSYVIMGQAVLSSLFGGPLVTLLGKISNDVERCAVGEAILRMQLLVSSLVALVILVVALVLNVELLILLLVLTSFIGLSYRDALRSVLAARNLFQDSLILSTAFAVMVTCGIAVILMSFDHVTVVTGLAVLAACAALSCSPYIIAGLTKAGVPLGKYLHSLAGMAVWSLPGAIIIWLQNSFYLTLVALNLSLSAVGEISAARMLIMPILIVTSGVLRLFQVHASRRINDTGLDATLKGAWVPVLICLATGLIIASVCFVLDRSVIHNWMPTGHPHILLLAGAWILFAMATTVRGIYSSLFQAMGRYREIFTYNAALLPLVLAGVALAPRAIGLVGAILPMIIGELLLFGLLVWRARKYRTTTV